MSTSVPRVRISMHQATSDRHFDLRFFNELDLSLRFTLQWYRLIDDDLLVKLFIPGNVAVQAYPWSTSPIVWWDPSCKKRKRTGASDKDESFMGPVDLEAEFEKPKDEEDDGGDGVAAGTTGIVGAAVHPIGDS